MSTPAGPISAPPPAAAAPAAAPAAPSSTPATPSAPATPATPVTPGAPPPAAGTPASQAPPAAPQGPPKNTDFPNNRDGQIAFLAKLKEFEANKPPAVGPTPTGAAEAQAAAPQLGQQPEDAAKPAEAGATEQKPGEPAKPAAPEPPAPTPKQLADLLEAKPALKAALEADPEAKGQIFSMARRLAAAEPIVEMFPTLGDAQFAVEHTSALVGLKTASMRMVDMPETAPQLLEMLDSQFAIVGQDGKPVLDAQGQPTFANDRTPFMHAVVDREMQSYQKQFTAEVDALKAKLGGVYPNEQAKEMDQQRLDNLEYAQLWAGMWQQIKSGEFFKQAPPEIPADATPAFKAWAEAERAALEAKEAELTGKQQGAGKEQRATQAKQFKSTVRGDMGTIAGKLIGEQLRQIEEAGAYIPEFYKQQKYVDPATGRETNTADLVARIFIGFENELMKPGSRTLMEIAQHELLPANEQTRAIRKEWYQRRAADIIPKLMEKEVDRIQKLVKLDQDKQAGRAAERNQAAGQEPHSGGSMLPQGASEAQILTAAEEAAKKDPGFASATPGEKQARILTQVHRMRK